mgnify:CR=1 FL=1
MFCNKIQLEEIFLKSYLVGIYMLVPAFDFKTEQTKGLFMGLFSALAYALRNLIIKKRTKFQLNFLVLHFYIQFQVYVQ